MSANTETKPFNHAFSRKMFVRYLTHIEQEFTHHLALCEARGIAIPADYVIPCRPGFCLPGIMKPDSMRNINAFMSAWRFFTPTTVPKCYSGLFFGCTLNGWNGFDWKSITGVTVVSSKESIRLTDATSGRGQRWTQPPGKRDTVCYADKRAASGQSQPTTGRFHRKAEVSASSSDKPLCKWGDKCHKQKTGECRFQHAASSTPARSSTYDKPLCKFGAKCHRNKTGECRFGH